MNRSASHRSASHRPASLALAALLFASPASALAQERGATAFGEAMAGLSVSARVLVIGAHPDDEDTRLIAWLARGRQVETAYLSLTRGDGGQNLIGNELGEGLGVIRTEELLAARRIDGGRQYFARAYDFGFSKSAAEAYTHWPHDSLLQDVVTVIRAFRPQVIVSVFSGTPRDGHGQHQVAGLLAREAYDLAGDTARFPRARTAGYGPWTPLKFYRSTSYQGEGATLVYDAGEYSFVLGRSYAEIAGESRSQHKSQAFGVLQRKGSIPGSVRREASRVAAPDDPTKERSLFDGIDTTLARLEPRLGSGGASVRELVAEIAQVQHSVNLADPPSSVAALEKIARGFRTAIAAARRANGDPDVLVSLEEGAARASDALLLARGIAVEASTDRETVALGEAAPVQITIYNRGRTPVTATAELSDGTVQRIDRNGAGVRRDQVARAGDGTSPATAAAPAEAASAATIPPDSSLTVSRVLRASAVTAPWWLRTPRSTDLFAVPIDGRSEEEHTAGIQAHVAINGDLIETSVPVLHRFADPVRGEIRRPIAVAPAIAVSLQRNVELARAGTALDRPVRVTLRSAAATPRTVRVSLTLPQGLVADSASRSLTLAPGESRSADFRLRGTLPVGRHVVGAVAESDGDRFTTGYTPIRYDHIRPQTLYHDATETLEAVDVQLPPKLSVAYISGVGDNVAPMLEQLGVKVTLVDPARLATTDLAAFTTVVVGTRAYESQPDLVANNARLLEWVRGGGTMVVQYGQYEMAQPGIMPFPITLSRPADRVTDENAPVQVLRADDPLLSTPNKIGPADWRSWVQERSVYMPHTFAPQYTPLLSMNDPGEAPNQGALLVAAYGKGTYVYTTLALFRELPAGVPGAARLFANLLGAAPSPARATSTAVVP